MRLAGLAIGMTHPSSIKTLFEHQKSISASFLWPIQPTAYHALLVWLIPRIALLGAGYVPVSSDLSYIRLADPKIFPYLYIFFLSLAFTFRYLAYVMVSGTPYSSRFVIFVSLQDRPDKHDINVDFDLRNFHSLDFFHILSTLHLHFHTAERFLPSVSASAVLFCSFLHVPKFCRCFQTRTVHN